MSLKNRSIVTIVASTLVIITSLMFGLFALLNYFSMKTTEYNNLKTDLENDLEQLSTGLALPVWNFDLPQITKVIESQMEERNIYAIIVKAGDKIFAKGRDENWKIINIGEKIAGVDLVSKERTINAEDESIGTVKLYMTSRFMDQERRTSMWKFAAAVFSLDILLVFSLYILLWKILLKPLRKIEQYSVTDSNEVPVQRLEDIQFQGEIENVRKREIELKKYRENLEGMVKDRTEELARVNDYLKREIDKQKEFEMMLRNSLEKEKDLNEMKTRFISTTSHEFRTPLTSILSSAEIIQMYDDFPNGDKVKKHLDRIITNVISLTRLLEDLLTLSKSESGDMGFKPEKVSLFTIAQECIRNAKPLMQGNHEIKLSGNIELKEYYFDPKLMKFIFNNLLSNAIKYSPMGGSIELSISSDNENFRITVKDEGIGIPEVETGKIFDSFYRTKYSEKIAGTGLGLAIVKRAVELHRGKISVKSIIDKGSEFIIEIPILKNLPLIN